jgi:hypothetical protein
LRFPDFVRTLTVIFLKPEPLLNTVNGLIGQRVTTRPNLRVGSILISDLSFSHTITLCFGRSSGIIRAARARSILAVAALTDVAGQKNASGVPQNE